MSEPVSPPWVDDLFLFPTPTPLAKLLDIAWQHATEEGYYNWCELLAHYDFMFDLARVPRPPAGWECSPEFDDDTREPDMPMYAMPEFVPFGSLGDGGYVGWVVPAPELGRLDHPVCHADGHQHGMVLLGEDTRAGLEFLLSATLRKWRDEPWYQQHPVSPEDRELVNRVAHELGVHPDPERGQWPRRHSGAATTLNFDVPTSWRYEPGQDVVGVLAPADAFAGQEPVVARVELDEPLEPALVDAARHLDAGYPATALLGLKDTFVYTPVCYFPKLKPLWARAYRDLGRSQLVTNLDVMTAIYDNVPCFCDRPHT
jgi:hypothetical protein